MIEHDDVNGSTPVFATEARYKDLLTRLASLGAEALMFASEFEHEVTEWHAMAYGILDTVRDCSGELNMTKPETAEMYLTADAAAWNRVVKLDPPADYPLKAS